MSNTFFRYSVSNIQWKIIEPFVPPPKFGGHPALNSLTVFNVILWILEAEQFGETCPKNTVIGIVFIINSVIELKPELKEKIFQALVGKCKDYHLNVEIDSTFCKIHHKCGCQSLSKIRVK